MITGTIILIQKLFVAKNYKAGIKRIVNQQKKKFCKWPSSALNSNRQRRNVVVHDLYLLVWVESAHMDNFITMLNKIKILVFISCIYDKYGLRVVNLGNENIIILFVFRFIKVFSGCFWGIAESFIFRCWVVIIDPWFFDSRFCGESNGAS